MKYASAMRFGGSLVEAVECDYEDYKYLGLLCPECKDPVFLRAEGTRQQHGKEIKVGAHFCHFPGTDPSLITQCERRVSKYTPKELQHIAAQARGQRFKKFQDHFWKIFRSGVLQISDNKTEIEATLEFSQKCKEGASGVIEEAISLARRCDMNEWVRVCVKELLDGLPRAGNPHRVNGSPAMTQYLKKYSKIDLRMQSQICKEAVQFLRSKQGLAISEDIFSWLFVQYWAHAGDLNVLVLEVSNKVIQTIVFNFFMVICTIDWADEFAKLQKPSVEAA